MLQNSLAKKRDLHCMWIALVALVMLPPRPSCAQAPTPLKFTEVSKTCGIDWEHTTGRSKRGYIVEGITSGLSSFDYDRDGLIDLYFLNGKLLVGTPNPKDRAGFFRNLGDFQFKDVTDLTGVDGSGYGLGVCAADYDGDGFSDLFISNFGLKRLFLNCGDGMFCEATDFARVSDGEKVGAGVAFADFNGDELLDIYAGNYVDFTLENSVYIERGGQVYHAGPRYYRSVPDTLLQSVGDGTFENISEKSGITKHAGPTMGLIAADLNQDGHIDVFTCNDAKPNFFFINDGKGNFTEDGVLAGLAYDFRGTANASMGVDFGDFNADGLQDLISTNYQNELPVLYRNLGEGQFEDVSTTARVTEALQPHVTWGCTLTDFDNNGTLDLYIGCGHFDD
ncbi:MAG: VCBS repeat-containing protein, partial [Pirellulaceae bacterium]|nr:VCBS repeat-containing protein [Pirellulaceae bacterium]